MAPRKRRTKAPPKLSSKTRSMVKKVVINPEESLLNTEDALVPQSPPRKGRAASKHKKFGKFRCLLENAENSEENVERKEDEAVTNSVENGSESSSEAVPVQNDIETVTSGSAELTEDTTNTTVNIDESVNPLETDATGSIEMICNESEGDNIETVAAEVSQQLATLSVNNEINLEEVVKDQDEEPVQETPTESDMVVEEIENTITSNEIFNVGAISTEYTVECVTEEIIPVLGEQEVEIESTNDVETIKNSSTVPDVKSEEQLEISPKVEAETAPPAKSQPKTSKATKQKNAKPKAPIKKKSVATTTKTGKKEPKSKTKTKKGANENSETTENSVRRSNRIKSISVLKQRSKGQGLVKSKSETELKKSNFNDSDASENSNSGQTDSEKTSIDSPGFLTPNSGYDSDQKPVKVKSRWRRSSELEMGNSTATTNNSAHNNVNNNNNNSSSSSKNSSLPSCPETAQLPTVQNAPVASTGDKTAANDEEIRIRLKQFVHLKENLYLTDRVVCKEAKKMTCDCFLTPEETERGEMGCGEDCLNKLLMIECGLFCPVSDRCTNKRFQKSQFSPCEVFRTEKKGLGIRATANIPYGEFILEYIGEVIGPDEFEDRATEYSKDKNPHYYFMSLRSDAVIDATQKGNISRFINHSCEPNAETQKWTVNGELRIGFFSKRTILAGEEITFDYQFQRYGKEAQKCFCEATTCRGWLGEEPDEEEDDEEEEEEEEEEEDDDDEDAQVEKETIESQPAGPETATVSDEVQDQAAGEEESKIPAAAVVTVTSPATTEPKKPAKKEKKKLIKRKVRAKDIFDDVDVDEEIEMLMTTGLKNQAHTLKLSRLMVRANNSSQRTALLRILRHGEFPCRRLFLDYHGLRLVHGWMNDAQQSCKIDKKQESLRLELLQTLATLPISNKTVLQDSKVLPTVERWSTTLKDVPNVCLDSESNSPNIEIESICDSKIETKEGLGNSALPLVNAKSQKAEKEEDEDIRRSVGMEVENIRAKWGWYLRETDKKPLEEIIDSFSEEVDVKIEPKQEEKEYEVEIMALATKLLEEWSVLKEVFRIPKKERIEQMKEHEREADRGYKAGLEHDSERKTVNRYRMLHRYRIEKIDSTERTRKNCGSKADERSAMNAFPKINKHERRKLFALQVEQEEIERRLKQREMWRQHELYCMSIGADPRFTAPFDPTRNFHCVWNPQTGQWQNYPANPLLNAMGPRFNPAMPYAYSPMQPPLPNMLHHPPPSNINIPISIPTNVPPPNMHPYPPPPGNSLVSTMPPLANRLATLPNIANEKEDVSEVKFAGPIPPPVKLPSKWRCAKDKYGRPYYYHIKIRISQWEPPELSTPVEINNDVASDSSSSSETSSLSSDSSSEESNDNDVDDDDEDEPDDTKLLLEIRKKFQQQSESGSNPQQEIKECSPNDPNSNRERLNETNLDAGEINKTSSLDERLKEEFNLSKRESSCSSNKEPPAKRKRMGLVTEVHIISPRSEEDKMLAKENLRKYKENKERLKRQKEANLEQTKKRIKVTVKSAKKHKSTVKAKLKEAMDLNSESAKKIREAFRSNMAGVMVGFLNPFRKPDCKEGRITNTEDFKHLARKLTHFVMLKELKHCQNIEDLTCTESVKSKAKEFVRKYMSKFGESYTRPKDDIEY